MRSSRNRRQGTHQRLGWGAGAYLLALVAAALALPGGATLASPARSSPVKALAGEWRFDLDPGDVGIGAQWFSRELGDTCRLPGSTDENRKGTLNTRPPDFSGLSRIYEYVGPAWYQRTIVIPQAWRQKRVTLFLERCHWETQVWLDDRYCGMADSLCVPHVHELGTDLEPGRHRLSIRVDNSLKHNMGGAAHSTSDQTQTNWNGIIGRIELRATPQAWIEGVQVHPDAASGVVRVVVALRNLTGEPTRLAVEAIDPDSGTVVASGMRRQDGSRRDQDVELGLRMRGGTRQWDEFSPKLYDLKASLAVEGPQTADAHEVSTTFGLRDLRVHNKRLVLNERPIFLRGTLECCIFPLTGYPPTDTESWLRILGIARSYGLNHMRFHSWCPPEAAFAAADQMGFLLHVEAPQWVGDVGRDAPRDEFIEQEVLRILDTYGSHPSFGMLCMGNELGGEVSFLEHLVALAKTHDPRHLYSSSTAWSFCPSNDYNVAVVRGLHGPSTDTDFAANVKESKVPLVSHEVGQWTVFPNLAEVGKYKGVLRPRNFELVREGLEAHHLLPQAEAFTGASGQLSAALYKEEIEVLLRTPGHAGFQLLQLHDFPGQGTALVGLLDAFWGSKGIIRPAEFRRFCGPTVPLARLSRRTFTTGETLTAEVDLAHYGPADLPSVTPRWSLHTQRGEEIAAGALPARDLATGDLHRLGAISVPLESVPAPAKLTLTVTLAGTEAANDWDVWVYPDDPDVSTPDDVLVTRSTHDALAALDEGRRVLLWAGPTSLVDGRPGSFTPVFWSPVWFRAAARGTMGLLCDPAHPALAHFPTDAHANWQWYDLLQRSRAMRLDGTPPEFQPIVQVIDNFTLNQKLGNLLEAQVGEGRLLASSINLWDDLEHRPAARQLRASLLAYMASDRFRPRHELTAAHLSTFLQESRPSTLSAMGARVVMADSEDRAHGNVAANAIDDDPQTIWHTEWGEGEPRFPHEIQVDMQKTVTLAGFRYLPRQDMRNGWFEGYEFYVSEDGTDWGQAAAKGSFAPDDSEQVVRFADVQRGRYIRLVALTGVGGNPWAAVAELDVILAGPPGGP